MHKIMYAPSMIGHSRYVPLSPSLSLSLSPSPPPPPLSPSLSPSPSPHSMQGKLKYREHVTDGFDNMFDAFLGLFKEENIGKAVVKA